MRFATACNALVLALSCACIGYAQVGTKITDMTDMSTNAVGADLLYIVDDPAGTPLSKKVSLTNLFGNLKIATLVTIDSASALVVEDSSNQDVVAVDTSTPKVVIGGGVVTPLYIGHTSDDAGGGISSLLQVHGSGEAAGLGCVAWSADADGPVISMTKSRSATKGTHGIITTGDVLGWIDFYGDDGVDLNPNAAANGQIQCVSTGTIGADRIPTYITCSVSTDAAPSVLTEIWRTTSTALQAGTAGSWALRNLEASTTVPTLCPDNAGTATGLGGMADASFSGIVNGVEIWRTLGSGLAFGTTAGRPYILFETATATNPVWTVNTNMNTGIGGAHNATEANAYVSAIVDSTEIVRFTKTYADCKLNLFINTPTLAGNLANGIAMKNGTAASASMTDSVQLWAADAGGVAGHSGLYMRGEDDASNLVVVGYKEESANAETPQEAATPGTICKFVDSGDASGDGIYILALDGTTWTQID